MKRLRVTVDGKTYEVEVEILDEGTDAPVARRVSSAPAQTAVPIAAARLKAVAPASPGSAKAIRSPLGAVVVSIDVKVGEAVTEGQRVVTLEAMKMNTIVHATAAGTVQSVHVKAGDGVEEGQMLIELA